MEVRLRATPDQFSALLEFMERHGDLSKPLPGHQARLRSTSLWRKLTNELNSIQCGVQKSSDKWKKVWADWKAKTKKKYITIRRHASAGGDPSSRIFLTPLEERVIKILVGQDSIKEQGSNNGHVEVKIKIENAEDDPLASTPSPPPSPPPTRQPTSDTQPSLPLLSQPVSLRPQGTQRMPLRSLRSMPTTPQRLQARMRRNLGLTPLDRVISEFVAVEQRRLELEERRERDLHERETERLRLESERIEVTRETNHILQQLGAIAQTWVAILQQNSPR